MTESVIVSDTSPLHYLVLIDGLPLLERLASRVLIPPAVARELSHDSAPRPVRAWISRPPGWLKIVAPIRQVRSFGLDEGETEAIRLALESSILSILIDERKGFRVATAQGLKPFGLLAVLESAAAEGLTNQLRRVFGPDSKHHLPISRALDFWHSGSSRQPLIKQILRLKGVAGRSRSR